LGLLLREEFDTAVICLALFGGVGIDRFCGSEAFASQAVTIIPCPADSRALVGERVVMRSSSSAVGVPLQTKGFEEECGDTHG